MKRFLAVIVAILIAASGSAQVASAGAPQYQKTLATFAAGKTELTQTQLDQVFKAVFDNPEATKFICTGIRLTGASTKENVLVRTRAKNACDYAKSINPNLSTWVQSKPTTAKNFVGKVLITIKTQEAPVSEIDGRSLIDQPDAISGFQVKPVFIVPSDGLDTMQDVNGAIETAINQGNEFLLQTIGKTLPIDMTLDGQMDIGFVRSSLTQTELSELDYGGFYLSDLVDGTEFVNLTKNRKVIAFFADIPRTGDYCGLADTPGYVSITLMQGDCAGPAHGMDNYFSKTWVHEVFHNFGVEHVGESCDLMQSTYDYPDSEPCYTSSNLTIDVSRSNYFGNEDLELDIARMQIWNGSNLLPASAVSACQWTYKEGFVIRGTILCTVGVVQLGPADGCWYEIDRASLQEFKNGSWVNIGIAKSSTDPWGDKDFYSCFRSTSVGPTIELQASEAGTRWFRWVVNGTTEVPFRVIFQQ